MKKSLIALAALGLFAGAASAQSSVTISGKIDQSVGKKFGTKSKEVMDNAGSRIGFSGYEAISSDLGALFAFEHRFFPDDGTGEFSVASPNTAAANNPSANKFWNGFAMVGLRSASLGTVTLGRQYTSAFLLVQNQIDPFEGEGVGALRNIAIGAGGASPAQLVGNSGAYAGPAKVRVDNSVKYAHKFGPVSVSADLAEATTAGSKRPYSLAAAGAFGPVWVGMSYENPEEVNDKVFNLGLRGTIGPVLLSGMYSTGAATRGVKYDMDALLLGAKVTVGSGDIKLGYVTRKHEAAGTKVTVATKSALGYDHNLSKRTKVYVQFAHEGKAVTTEKNAYEIGMQHKF